METPHEPKVKSPKLGHGRPDHQDLCHFGLFYALVLWVGLSISLMPRRKVSLLLLMATTIITNQYFMMLQLMPKSICMRRTFDKMVVLVLMPIVTTVGLIVRQAAVHLFVTLGIGLPVMLVHVVFWRDGPFVNEEASTSTPGELGYLVDGRIAKKVINLLQLFQFSPKPFTIVPI
ncbi:hypothetical protein BT93_L2087 [Corymbia citriodora subsp. variegata]|uniref:PRA1 family protein n=1 Tax=Corymbia citriodora subsp. variegata TaxID=360336 RepID=A0A8T0CM93_CORYI|nr:hypothetical protein BT93_L2087 [Corymbia citriodora subsp. variegata]